MNTTTTTTTATNLTEYRAAGFDPDSSANQRIRSHLVQREVVLCVSGMISELSQCDHAGTGLDIPDLDCILVQDDWQEPAEDHIREMDESELVEALDDLRAEYEVPKEDAAKHLRAALMDAVGAEVDGWREFCEHRGRRIEPHQNEALEHWIVYPFLARKLSEAGEMILEGGPFGLGPIWGRCCSGQAIAMDGVIAQIACGMEILEGQRNAWKE